MVMVSLPYFERDTMTDTLIDLGSSTHHRINKRAWFEDLDGWRTVYVNYCPFWNYAVDDQAGLRLCLAMLATNDIASVRDIGEAFGVSHAFVHKLAARLKKEGLDGIHPDKSGPRGPMKMSVEVRRYALRLIHEGQSVRKVAAATGERFGITISHNTIAILKRKTLRPEPQVAVQPLQKPLPGGTASALIIPADLNGVETQYGGAFLYFAALAQLQVVSIWNRTLFWNQKLGYMLSEVVLTLLFLMVLRFPTVESSKKALRRHLAPLLGLDQAPSIPTLRRKIGFLAAQKQGESLMREHARLARDAGLIQLGVLYIDGHFKPYYGEKPISKGYFSQRRLAHPGLMQYFVNDIEGRPLFFVTEEAHVSMVPSLKAILAKIREVVGQEAPLTLVFDRGGWSLELFQWLAEQPNTWFITYEKGGKKEPCPEDHFAASWVAVSGERTTYQVCDRMESYTDCGQLRRIVVRRSTKQTPIITNDSQRTAATVCHLMFARWTQENFFGYLKKQYQLDALIGYGDEPADGKRLVKNPAKAEMKKKLDKVKEAIEFFQGQLGEAVLDPYHQDRSVSGLKRHEKTTGKVRELEAELADLERQYREIPAKVALNKLVPEAEIRRLKTEKKILVDILKMQAYLAEDLMVQRLAKHYDEPEDIRQVLQILTHCRGRLQITKDTLTVELEPPERPKYARALRGLCEELTAERVSLPWGSRRLVFTVPEVEEVSTAA